MTDIPIPIDLLDALTAHLVRVDGSVEGSLLAGRLIAAKAVATYGGSAIPTIQYVPDAPLPLEHPDFEFGVDLQGETLAFAIVDAARRGFEPSEVTFEVGYDVRDDPFPSMVYNAGIFPPFVVVQRPIGGWPVPEGDTQFDDDLVDLPEEPIWGNPDPNTEQSA